MPSPVGHLLGGASVYLAATGTSRRSGILLATTLLASIAPDFDFVPGILIGDMRAFHHGLSHSLPFAAAFGAVVFLAVRRLDTSIAGRASVLACLGYISHIILDFVSVNQGARGVPLLWPVSDESLGMNLHLFGHFRYGDISEGVWSVVRRSNLSPLVRELSILGALLIVLVGKEHIRRSFTAMRRRRAPGRSSSSDAAPEEVQ